MKRKLLFFTISYFIISTSFAQNSIIPGTVRVEENFNHISVVYEIDGDLNLNSTMSVQYRQNNTGAVLLPSAPPMRSYPGLVVDGNSTNRNFHACSVMFLNPDTEYELHIQLTDPDGGDLSQTIVSRTKSYPTEGSTYKYVSPGSGGGSGTQSDPYRGLQTAANNAGPGDTFIVLDGTYSNMSLSTSGNSNNQITFRSENMHSAIIDGNNAGYGNGCINLNGVSNIIFDGFVMQNANAGIYASRASSITLINNIIEDVNYGYLEETGSDGNLYISNNSLTGRTTWPRTDGLGWVLTALNIFGNNNVVSYNYITQFEDAIANNGQTYNLDIHNNNIYKCVDDGIEADGAIANVRIYSNRIMNTRTGVSAQPVYGGPIYIFRNYIFNQEYLTFKLNNEPAGLLMCNNSMNKLGTGFASNTLWKNTIVKNNIISSSDSYVDRATIPSGTVDDWDYNAYIHGSGWEWGSGYSSLQSFQSGTGHELNGLMMSLADIENWALPTSKFVEFTPADRNASLTPNSALINRGVEIDNINIPFVSDGMTDIGAFEFGEVIPNYGPDFDISGGGNQNSAPVLS